MLKVECESCKAPYQVDERRVPAGGLKMRCPKCGHTFVVKNGAAAASAPPEAKPAAPAKPPAKQTMMGMGGSGSAPGADRAGTQMGMPPVQKPPAPAPRPAAGPLPDLDDDPFAELPVAKPIPPRVGPSAFAGAPPPAPSVPAPLGHGDDLDLPAISDGAGLPAPFARKPAASTQKWSAPAAPQAPPPPPPPQTTPGGFDFGEIDLPSPAADLPSAKSNAPRGFAPTRGGHETSDLPSPAGAGLPVARGGGRNAPAFGSIDADLPVIAGDLPMRHGGGGGGGFGEIDLPSLSGDLPSVPNNYPSVAGNLPSVAGNLPAVAGNLPSLGGNLPSLQNNLPAQMGEQRMMPALHGDFGELDLPRAQPVGMQLPSVHQGRTQSLAPDSGGGFGELDLPGPDQAPAFAPEPPVSAPSVAPSNERGQAAGGMAFGEVDLGGGDAGSIGSELAAAPGAAISSGVRDPRRTADLEAAKRRARTVVIKRTSHLPKILVGGLVVVILAGAGLQLTPFGAFGNLVIGDTIHSKDYAQKTAQASEAARKRLGGDTFADAKAAFDEIGAAHAATPRARALTAYASLTEYATELRFGRNAERNARAKLWLNEVPPGQDTRYAPVAQAAQEALGGDPAKARKELEAAARLNAGDPVQQDIALVRGEVELLAKDPAAAAAAFGKAVVLAPSARAHFGLARAYDALGDSAKARDAVNAALKVSPLDAGALLLRAKLSWIVDHAEPAAMKDLATVLEGPAKPNAALEELARGHAQRGWIHLRRDRPTEARVAFEEAIRLDARNVPGLVGQGEVLFADGRFTEALARFDVAVQSDPTSVDAIVGDSKAQIALERLADAKTQLSGARAKYPKDMRVALWLGKAEEALGNKNPAEAQYLAAVDLVDPAEPDAISPYVALSSLLASAGRPQEAQQKLDDARKKLPDSATLQRAFGEVAAAQGHYEEAVRHYESTLEKDPSDLATRFRLGTTLRRMRNIPAAAAELDKVYAADKEYPGLALERGLLFEESGEVQKALEMFKGAMAKAPNDPDLQLRVGAAYVAIGQPEEGIPMLKKVLEQRTNSAEARHYYGRALLLQGALQQAAAMRELKKAVELDPNRAEYHLYVGWAANEANPADFGLARLEIEKALSLDKLLADAYWQLGSLDTKEGALEDAVKHLRRALELKPTRFEAHASLAEALEKKNDLNGALAEWTKALAVDDKKPLWRYQFGHLLIARGNIAAGAGHLGYAVDEGEKESPRPGWVAPAEYEAADALKRAGKNQEAIKHYQTFMEIGSANSPDRADAKRSLAELGAPWQGRSL